MKRRVLLVTNDFPPRHGGIQSFLFELVSRLPAEDVAVYCSDFPGAGAFDAGLPFPVQRHPTTMLLPTPGALRRISRMADELGTETVWFGAAAPLGLLGKSLAAGGARRVVATTHGHEVGWAMLPGARQMLRRVAAGADAVTYLGEYTRRRLAPVVGDRSQLVKLAPGVDLARYSPSRSGAEVRARWGLGNRPVVVCVSRLVRRKGQDTLIEALPAIRAEIPDAAVLIVGRGKYERELRAAARRAGVAAHVVFTGAVDQAELGDHYAAGDVFAMPCRTRRLGLDVEGLGMVFLEASATGMPVVAGDSGGAPDAVIDGTTGFVVDGKSPQRVANRIIQLLQDRALAQGMGAAGRRWVQTDWRWELVTDRLTTLLGGSAAG